ncbi:MAG: hypothetical protein ACTSUE_27705 [Promethearchaeota archaeon]
MIDTLFKGMVKDFQEHDDLRLSLYDDFEATLKSCFGIKEIEDLSDFGGALIKTQDGEILEIFAFQGIIPFDDKPIYQIF